MIQNIFKKNKLTYDGEYRGYVVDIMDPLELGRVRVRVWGISDNASIPVKSLPWAKPKPSLTNGSIGKFGSFFVPDLNSKVSIEFEDGNPMSPVYKSEAPDGIDGLPDFRLTNYPYRAGFALSNGSVFYVDKSTNTVQVLNPNGLVSVLDLTQERLAQTGDLKASIQTATHPGWLLIDGISTIGNSQSGATYSGPAYQALFLMLGGTGWDSGAKKVLPDGRGKTMVGLDNMGGVQANILTSTFTPNRNTMLATIGEESHLLTGQESGIQEHDHSVPYGTNGSGGTLGFGNWSVEGYVSSGITGDTDAVNEHNNVQPGLMICLFVKI